MLKIKTGKRGNASRSINPISLMEFINYKIIQNYEKKIRYQRIYSSDLEQKMF